MDTYQKKRLEILVEAPIAKKVAALLQAKGAHGYTILPTLGGLGHDGAWSSDGQISSAGQMVMILCILDQSVQDAVLDELFPLLSRQIGTVSVSDCEVVRRERF